MDPNIKLVLEKMKELHAEMKDGFAAQEAAIAKRVDEVAAAEHIWDARISDLEETAAVLDMSFIEWRPAVDSSISAIKLELSKLNSFFDRDVRASASSSPGVLQVGSAFMCPYAGLIADGPAGHRAETCNQDCGFGRVCTLTHDLVKGTMLPPSLAKFSLP
jgi:hypothetical protein